MSLATKDFIKTIIDSGADASMNLFTLTFRPLGLKDKITEVENAFSCRVTNIANLLQRDNATVDVPYQNVTIPKISSGSALPKKLTFTIRLDDAYYVWDNLRQLQSIDTFGNIIEDESKKLKILVSAYKPASISSYSINNTIGTESLYSQYIWTFNDCYITGISPISYGYDNTNVGTTTVSFIWKTYEENREDEQSNRGSVQSILENTSAQKQSVTLAKSASQSLVDLSIGKTSMNLGFNYNTASVTKNSEYNNSTFLENINRFEGTTASNERLSSDDTSKLAKASLSSDINDDFLKGVSAISNTAFTNQSSISTLNPIGTASPDRSATETLYQTRNNSSSSIYQNAIQKTESIKTTSELSISKPMSTVLDRANVETKHF